MNIVEVVLDSRAQLTRTQRECSIPSIHEQAVDAATCLILPQACLCDVVVVVVSALDHTMDLSTLSPNVLLFACSY